LDKIQMTTTSHTSYKDVVMLHLVAHNNF
jgi:hypothetical protein